MTLRYQSAFQMQFLQNKFYNAFTKLQQKTLQ